MGWYNASNNLTLLSVSVFEDNLLMGILKLLPRMWNEVPR